MGEAEGVMGETWEERREGTLRSGCKKIKKRKKVVFYSACLLPCLVLLGHFPVTQTGLELMATLIFQLPKHLGSRDNPQHIVSLIVCMLFSLPDAITWEGYGIFRWLGPIGRNQLLGVSGCQGCVPRKVAPTLIS